MTKRLPQGKCQWQVASELFPPLDSLPQIDALHSAIQKVWPLTAKHRRSLPRDIRELSAVLTTERHELRTPYWNRPAFVSAYLYYFLPWNIVRLLRLFAGLRLPSPPADSPLLLDAGSGPLTLPLALWLARPEWRRLPLQIVALDSARQPLSLGKAIFETLAATTAEKPWPIQTVTGPLQSLPRFVPAGSVPWLVSIANTLNELNIYSRAQVGEDAEAEADEAELRRDARAERFERLLLAWRPLLSQASLLAIEPGTRLGGGSIMLLREAALRLGFFSLAPCTHHKACPLLNGRNGWCHFVFSAQAAPAWLKTTAREAHLFKTSLSLSMLLLDRKEPQQAAELPVRVISQSFAVQGEPARYGCASCGLCLLPGAKNAYAGSLCLASPQHANHRDARSGAFLLRPLGAEHKNNKNWRKS